MTPPPARQPVGPARRGSAVERHTLLSGGDARQYLLIRPAAAPPGPVPLVLDLHGSGFDPADQLKVSRSRLFAERGAVVVVPRGHIPFRLFDGWPQGCAWNVPGTPLPGESGPRDGPNDLRFIADLLGTLISRPVASLSVDPRRVHVMGYSGGARLASHLPSALPWLASVACVAGLRYPVPLAGNAVAVAAVHGADDPINPYRGGAGPRWSASVEHSAALWAAASGCSREAASQSLGQGVVECHYRPAASGADVRLVTVPGCGHAWPGARDPTHASRFGACGSFDATGYLARFFRLGEWPAADR